MATMLKVLVENGTILEQYFARVDGIFYDFVGIIFVFIKFSLLLYMSRKPAIILDLLVVGITLLKIL